MTFGDIIRNMNMTHTDTSKHVDDTYKCLKVYHFGLCMGHLNPYTHQNDKPFESPRTVPQRVVSCRRIPKLDSSQISAQSHRAITEVS